jgi:hypothetical protein
LLLARLDLSDDLCIARLRPEDANIGNTGVDTMAQTLGRKFVLCVRNSNCDDLELRKVCQVLPDKKTAKEGYLLVIDESGEDDLCPESCFVPVTLSPQLVTPLSHSDNCNLHGTA